MNNTLINFKNKFETRFNSQSILNLGEDSVRYDFFISLMEENNLRPHHIQVEYPVNPNSYIPRNHINSKRNENPQIDLYAELEGNTITAEFGLFKRNSNIEAAINTTEKQFKLLNDILRLSLNKIYLPNDAYFICIADSKIIGAQMRGNILPAFPALEYNFNWLNINNWISNIDSAKSVFDHRFVEKATLIQLEISSELVFNEIITSPIDIPENTLQTRALIYKIKNLKYVEPETTSMI